ncbi:hypothetical protein F01_460606 [Burkholderia cenocepacia]|nr:hypothetical protein F01_460606 [Burkholderia cenocepacia]
MRRGARVQTLVYLDNNLSFQHDDAFSYSVGDDD